MKMNPYILEILLFLPSVVMVISVLSLPFYLERKICFLNNRFLNAIALTTMCVVISGIVTFIYVYWTYELSNDLLIRHLRYNEYEMDESEYFQNVKPEYIGKAKEIRESQMGISWILKAILSFVVIALPYEIVTSLILGWKSKINTHS